MFDFVLFSPISMAKNMWRPILTAPGAKPTWANWPAASHGGCARRTWRWRTTWDGRGDFSATRWLVSSQFLWVISPVISANNVGVWLFLWLITCYFCPVISGWSLDLSLITGVIRHWDEPPIPKFASFMAARVNSTVVLFDMVWTNVGCMSIWYILILLLFLNLVTNKKLINVCLRLMKIM